MFKTIANPDGTISIVPIEQTNNLPFNVGGQLFNQFNNAGAVPNMTSFDPRSIQSIFPTNFPTGITASSAAIPFGSPVDIAQGFVKGSPSDISFPGANFQFLPSANEDETDVVEEKKRGGIADLFRALLGFAIPGASFFLNQGRDALGGIRSLNQRLRNTDFAKSSSLADYFDARKYGGRDERDAAAARNMAQARGIQKKIDRGEFGTASAQDKARGQIPSRTTSAPKKSSSNAYSEAKRSFFRD